MRELGYVTGVRYPLVEEASGGWINFNGTGTIAIFSSFNVSSIVDNGTGDWTINWTVPFSSADYALSMLGRYDGSTNAGVVALKTGTTPSVTAVNVRGGEGGGDTGVVDLRHVMVIAYGRGVFQNTPGEEQLISTWAQWDVTGALQDSENVSSITDNGTGDWTMNMRVPYASEALYAAGGTTQGVTIAFLAVKISTAIAAGSINFQAGGATGAATDPTKVCALAVGYY